MATYQETVYANDSWEIDGYYSQTPIRASQITAKVSFEFYVGETIPTTRPKEYGKVQFVFPKPSKYSKKRLTEATMYLYVVESVAYNFGNLLAGDFINQITDSFWGSFVRRVSYDHGSKYDLNSIPSGRYLDIYWYHGNALGIKSGVTDNLVKYTDYESEAHITFHSHLGANKPYAVLKFEDVVPYASNISPASGFVNEKAENTFSWKFNYQKPWIQTIYGSIAAITGTIYQQKAKFRWRPYGASSYTEIIVNGDTQSITIPANTFSTDQIQWQVVVTSDDGIEGTPSEWFTLTTIDSPASAQPVNPMNMTVDGTLPISFRWNHIIETGSPQSKFDLEYSTNNGLSWIELKSEETADTFTEIPANTLPAGNLLWRVRTYNSDGVVGEWSDAASFVVLAAPQTPAISSITSEARPVVRWQAVGQQAYEVEVYAGERLVYTTGETAGTTKEHKIKEYLLPGSYTVRVRVWNTYNIDSPWGTGSVQVPTPEIEGPAAEAEAGEGYGEIRWSGESFVKFYILRDGVPIARVIGNTYRDYAAAGKHSYIVRGVTDADQFADSMEMEVVIPIPYTMLAPVSDLSDWVQMVYRREADPNWTENLQSMGQPVYVAGRTRPIFEAAEYWNNTVSMTYSYLSKEELDKLRELVMKGETVRYRRKDNGAHWLALTGLQVNGDYMSREFTVTGQEVDYDERVAYD